MLDTLGGIVEQDVISDDPTSAVMLYISHATSLDVVSLQPTSNRPFPWHKEGGDMIENVVEYMAICRHSLGFVIGFDLVLYFLGLDEYLIHLHLLVEEFYDLVLDYICMCNNFLL